MQASDRQIRELLSRLDFATEPGFSAFSAAEQVQPASIDLRLSGVFWKPLRLFTIDLRRSKLLEISPRRYYRKVQLEQCESIILKPRELLLGRTLEEFSVPNGFAADLGRVHTNAGLQ